MDEKTDTKRPQKGGRRRQKFDHRKKFGFKPKYSDLIEGEVHDLKSRYEDITDTTTLTTFKDIPLSENTLKGLKEAGYETPTEIQRESIIHALRGNDILGAAKTGSGKTLAFMIPILEGLYRCKWNKFDGLGALVISPTRELAYQIFEVLRKIGTFHDFSAGLVIGGKFIREEAERIGNTNIVICTPGRLLQHMDETAYFNADNLQMLVLDEADRCLDLGFQRTMNAIIHNLPRKRQTLLFSATQTKSVKDLARLSLKDPIYVSVHEHAEHSTPAQLHQSYMVCELHQKLDLLWSFVKNHLKNKILVFIQSCKQVRFIFEMFRRLRPGTTVLCLHGAMKQLKRMEVYDSFCRKEYAVLFATDIAARGLDFPAVNWVVQLDCPEDANTYIHRAGRTARYQEDGEALLVLIPSEEEAMVKHLADKKIPIDKIKVNPKKQWSVQPRIESWCAAEVEMKEFAQRAFVAYVKSVFLMKDKSVFDVSKLDTDQYANSLGLAIPPRIRFLKKQEKFSQQIKSNKSTQELIDKLTASAPGGSSEKSSTSNKLTDSGHESESESDSNDAQSKTSEARKKVKSEKSTKTTADNESSDEQSASESGENDSEDESENSDEDESEEDTDHDSDNSEGSDEESYEDQEDSATNTMKLKSDKINKFNFDVGDEDLADIFTVKKKTAVKPTDDATEKETIEDIPQGRRGKVITKTALAKKALKKNFQANLKVVFDEEGEELFNPLHGKKTEIDSDDSEGGIDIKTAQERMKAEDKKDKEVYRQRVRAMHKEKKLKEKEKKKKKQKEGEDEEEGEAILDSQESGSALDFIPDPDEVYGSKNSDSDEESDDEDEDSPPKKRRHKESSSEESIQEDESEEEDITEGISLDDQESLALKLLG